MEIPITQGQAFWGPLNLPAKLINQISKAIEKAVKDPEFIGFCRKTAYQPVFKDMQRVKENVKIYEENVGPKLATAFPNK